MFHLTLNTLTLTSKCHPALSHSHLFASKSFDLKIREVSVRCCIQLIGKKQKWKLSFSYVITLQVISNYKRVSYFCNWIGMYYVGIIICHSNDDNQNICEKLYHIIYIVQESDKVANLQTYVYRIKVCLVRQKTWYTFSLLQVIKVFIKPWHGNTIPI